MIFSGSRFPWKPALAAGLVVLLAQLALVSLAGTDVPFHDQWDAEGRLLYSRWEAGALGWEDLMRAHNEHRILWTSALNLLLYQANGQWDPLVQLVANAGLHALVVALLAGLLSRGMGDGGWRGVAAGTAVLSLPLAGWHNALWGFQSQVYASVGWSLVSLALLSLPAPSGRRQLLGIVAGLAAMLAMGAGMLLPVPLLALAGARAIGRRQCDAAFWRESAPAWLLLGVALALRVPDAVGPGGRGSAADFLVALGRLLAWPHVDSPWSALVLNAPAVLAFGRRLRGSQGSRAEDFVLALASWSMAVAVAAAWTRSGTGELRGGVPSRYVDFVMLLPLANAWCAWSLFRAVSRVGRCGIVLWTMFLALGWIGLSAEVARGLVLPRARDPLAPVRLMRAYQLTGDPQVFAGQPRLLVPHPDLRSVDAVLHDPRLAGRLPPSLQPERPVAPLSRAARGLLGRSGESIEPEDREIVPPRDD